MLVLVGGVWRGGGDGGPRATNDYSDHEGNILEGKVPNLLIWNPEAVSENMILDSSIVDSNRSASNLHTVDHNVVRLAVHVQRVGIDLLEAFR